MLTAAVLSIALAGLFLVTAARGDNPLVYGLLLLLAETTHLVALAAREAAGADCIVADATQGLRETLDYLTALGHRRIAYVQGSARSWSNAHRVEVIRALVEQYDIDLELLDWQTETVEGGTAAGSPIAGLEIPSDVAQEAVERSEEA